MRYAMFILYVRDQQRSREFYRAVLEAEPILDVPGMTEFQLTDTAVLGLMPEAGIARIICPAPVGSALAPGLPHPGGGDGVPRCELYIPSPDPAAALARLVGQGGVSVSEATLRDWGDVVAYGADLDAHVLAFAAEPRSCPPQSISAYKAP
jgi:catechol 2,3-dioxygenase-like lactoylglutathione lyase family enzyme